MSRGTWSTSDVGSPEWQTHWLACASATLVSRGQPHLAVLLNPEEPTPEMHRTAATAVGPLRSINWEDPAQVKTNEAWEQYRSWAEEGTPQ
jgi:hypothetical protein